MWGDPLVSIVGLAVSVVLLVLVVVALQRWRRHVAHVITLDERASQAEVSAATRRMERARYLTHGLALLALVPANPAVFLLILRHPRLHFILGFSCIAFILGAALKAITKLNLGLLFPTRPARLTVLRSVAIGLCLGFVLLLGWQMAAEESFRRGVIGAWKAK